MSAHPSVPSQASTLPFTSPSNEMGSAQPPSSAAPESFYATRAWVSQPVVASFMAGGIAGAVSRTVVSPLERLKILLQVQSTGHTEYKMSINKALAKIWREEGFKGMMAGNGTNCVRIVPYSAVQFGSYNFYKRVRHQRWTCNAERRRYEACAY
jgi:solute carrier family 25 phosphate transporter 23/24/25/41